jgi:hypothetical protein
MNRRKFVKWLTRLPPSVWLAVDWLPVAESAPKTIEVVMFMHPKWNYPYPSWDKKGRELWYPLSPSEIQKVMKSMRPYHPRGSWEESMRQLEALADDHGQIPM